MSIEEEIIGIMVEIGFWGCFLLAVSLWAFIAACIGFYRQGYKGVTGFKYTGTRGATYYERHIRAHAKTGKEENDAKP